MKTTDQIGVIEQRALEPASAGKPFTISWLRTPPARRLAGLGVAVVAAWVVSGLAVIADLGWVLLPLLVVAVASVLRCGRNVVDRLVFALIIVAGALVSGGLLFSLWPWGFAPFPVAGCLFTAVAVAAWVGRRAPERPRGFELSDLVILGTGVFVLLAEVRPLLRVATDDRFRFTATAEDRAAHFALFDTIHRLGSYPFFDQVAARLSLRTPTESVYPAGSHLLYAITDTFLRTSAEPGPAVAAFDRYFVMLLCGYALMAALFVWAARWIIAPMVGGWRLFAAAAAISALVIGGPLMGLVMAAFDSQILGLAVLAVTVAVAVRPPTRLFERLMLLGSGVILITYIYDFYLPLAVLAVLATFVVDRRVLRRSWRPILVAAVIVAAISAVPLLFAVTSSLSVKAQAVANGSKIPLPTTSVIAATFAGLAALAVPRGLRLRGLRTAGLLLIGSSAVVAVFGGYQLARLGHTSYYFDKLLVSQYVIGIICAAPLVMFLRPMASAGGTAESLRTASTGGAAAWRDRLREPALGLLAAAFAFVAIAGFGAIPRVSPRMTGTWGDSPLGRWFTAAHIDQHSDDSSDALKLIAQRDMLGDGKPTLFLVSDNGYINWRVTFYCGVLNHNNGTIMPLVEPLLKLEAGGQPQPALKRDRAVDEVVRVVSLSEFPIRVAIRDPELYRAVRDALAARPQLPATVVSLA